MSSLTPVYSLPPAERVILGAGGIIGRVMAALDTHTPTIFVGGERMTHVHRFDVVILGNNSLLAALAARTATERGHSVLLSGAFGMEGMPVGLADDPAFRLAACRAAGSSGRLEDALMAAFSAKVSWCRQRVDLELWKSGAVAVLSPRPAYSTLAVPDALSAVLRRQAEARCSTVTFPLRGKRRHGVLATKKVVVTSAVAGLALREEECDDRGINVRWSHEAVVGFGTARRNDRFVGDAVAAIMDDLALIASGDWLES